MYKPGLLLLLILHLYIANAGGTQPRPKYYSFMEKTAQTH